MRNSNGPGRFQPNNNPQAQGPKHSASSSPLQAPASDPIDQNLLEASPNDPIRSSPSEAATSEAGKTTANSDAEPVKDASDVSAQTPAVSNYVAASHVRPHSAKDVDKESFTRSGERADDSDYWGSKGRTNISIQGECTEIRWFQRGGHGSVTRLPMKVNIALAISIC